MESGRKTGEYALKALEQTGLERSACSLKISRTDEMNVEGGKFSLLRTTEDVSLSMSGIEKGCRGSITINKLDRDSIDAAAAAVREMAESSQPDEANDISPMQPEAHFEKGPEKPDLDLMFSRMDSFLKHVSNHYPTLIMEQAILDFTSSWKYSFNSNGVRLSSRRGSYSFMPMFTSKDGSDTSSFNYSGVSLLDLNRELWACGSVDTLMRQSTEQVRSRQFKGRFQGEMIITPDCLEDLVSLMSMYLSDYQLIKGTSIFKDSVGSRVAGSGLTLRSLPVSDEMAHGYFITSDGFTAQNSTVIDGGVLQGFLLSLYGSRKTGLPRAVNQGGCYVIDPGERSLADMIGSVKRGILLCRFSGGMPSESGDYSGVAKNSYYIEDGRLQYPVKEMMISGNIRELFLNISGISSERIDSGGSILPWVLTEGVSILGQ